MQKKFKASKNYESTREAIGYIPRVKATQKDYDRIGFMSGLEVHQQLKTKHKLFCKCPAGIYQQPDEYDAEVIRHMRPTLSELGEYDGTALMEFKTRKEIVYHISNDTACTYEVDDTPPFHIDREALEIAIKISLLSKLSIVGEVHITRKQYLDGSIPTGFQRTGIIGVEGELELPHKKIRLIQLSLEEDSCREVSDIGHTRVYRTDRLGMPLIETVTYPDCVNPDEVRETCDYIRFLNRSTGLVRTGIGAGRQDVNVSCRGGSRVEIKGVAHTKWIPELTHNECFRQWALLAIRDELKNRIEKPENWKIKSLKLNGKLTPEHKEIDEALKNKEKVYAVNLPGFGGLLSHFTQPGKMFADEIKDRLKVIACLQVPFIFTSEDFEAEIKTKEFEAIKPKLGAEDGDAQIIFWGPEEDIKTALETIEERCQMAFEGIPNETRKSFADGTTIFERVLPGADRMYPDTDTAPLPLANEYIDALQKDLPSDIIERYRQLKAWKVPEDTYTYIFSKNLYPVLQKLITEMRVDPVFAGTFIGHHLKYVEGHYKPLDVFDYKIIQAMFKYLNNQKILHNIAEKMLPVVYEHPKMDFDSVLESIGYKKIKASEIISKIPFLKNKWETTGKVKTEENMVHWVMGELRGQAAGNISFEELKKHIIHS
ncbi:MAG: Glu-tRNA(Gln) amidotransferase subunit GatE [Bacteroidales bacterium]|nr:Glu-tRNA(Gln) amidotransferase subunit GatE [Bacteroidales bacterium]MCF8404184.1 Glu-tRNA(Gln) amidotransferase subunit GatE [Bacteroidales bacterium]